MIKPQKVGHPAKLPDAPFDSCFYILNSNLNPSPEDYRAAFLINADVIDQTAPQFFPEFRLFSVQIFQLVDEVRENFPRVILLLDECLQFLKSAMLFTINGAELLFVLCLLRLIQSDTRILPDEVRKIFSDDPQFLLQPFPLFTKGIYLADRFNQPLKGIFAHSFCTSGSLL